VTSIVSNSNNTKLKAIEYKAEGTLYNSVTKAKVISYNAKENSLKNST